MIQQILTVTGGILGAVILLGAAATAGARLWRFRVVQILATPITVSIEGAVNAWHERQRERRIGEVNEALGVLFRPNGGASLKDLSIRIGRIEEHMGLPPWRSEHGEEVPVYDEDHATS